MSTTLSVNEAKAIFPECSPRWSPLIHNLTIVTSDAKFPQYVVRTIC